MTEIVPASDQGEIARKKEIRSHIMASVPRADTSPERLVRKMLHKMGFRFRLNRRDLPGSPDIVLPKHHVAIFVHGCFWHRHPNCKKTTTPRQNAAFWAEKFARNQTRDAEAVTALIELGWNVYIIWECEAKAGEEKLRSLLSTTLDKNI